MSLAKQAEMVHKLAELIESNAIDWKQSVNTEAFQVSFRDNTIRITTSHIQSEQDILIQLINNNG